MGWALTQIGFWSFHVCGYMLTTTKTSTSIDSFLFPFLFCNRYCCKMCSHKTLGSNEFLRIIMKHWWKENFQVSQDTFEFILNMKAVILNRFKSGNPPMFLNFRAVTNGSTKTRNPESGIRKWKRNHGNGNGNGIRNLWKKVLSDRFEKKYISNDNKINKQIKEKDTNEWISWVGERRLLYH